MFCPKCGVLMINSITAPNGKSRHHILPRRWWNGNGKISILCVSCHRQLEKLIDEMEGTPRRKLPARHYYDLLSQFLLEPS